jgi:CheY-like chemotaxis protein
MMGGQLLVDSGLGKGSVFHFSLELPVTAQRAADTPRPLVSTSRRVSFSRRHSRVLLVEDNPVNQRVATGLLTRRGHHVTVAQDGSVAVELLQPPHRFEVVLMDLQMPVMGGLKPPLSSANTSGGPRGRVRIVATTAHAMQSDRARCLAAGMDGYLSKPFTGEALYAVVEQVGMEPATTTVEDAATRESESAEPEVGALAS